jgi:transketolase
MRNAFLDTLFELARDDDRIVLITGDLGFGVVTRFMEQLPRQFVNAGVAEQNMTGLAAGMALSGKIVFTYSIANFPTLRCLEQIRNDLCYHRANVTVVSIGGGFAYGAMGATHHATEDLGIMRTLPEMVVVAPADPVETRHGTRAIVERGGPCYLRLGKAGERVVHQGPIAFELGRAIQVRDGRDVTLISAGALLHTALRVAERLAEEGQEARVLSMHTIKPLDEDAVLKAARETHAIATLEEHSVIGGLGSAVAEVLAEAGAGTPFKRIGLPSSFSPHIGGQEYLLGRHGLTDEAIVPLIRQLLERSKLFTGSSR